MILKQWIKNDPCKANAALIFTAVGSQTVSMESGAGLRRRYLPALGPRMNAFIQM